MADMLITVCYSALGWAQGWGSGVMSGLASAVHTCPSVQTHLAPALVNNYIDVSVVEGLDVDKEDFDKYSAR